MRPSLVALALVALSVAPDARGDGSVAGADARRLSDAFAAVAEHMSPSVVQLEVASREQQQARWYRGAPNGGESPIQRGLGSGVIFSADGAIVTNDHVVEDALSISVRLRDGRTLPARLVGRDPSTDLAVVKVEATGLPAAKFADSDAARVGEWVVAIGSPFGLGYTVTTGVLSAKGRGGVGVNAIEDYLQTDASINPGNSGGPLVNLDGQVLGINTMIVGKGQGIGFAVPSNLARRTAEQLLRTGRVQRGWIGVGLQDVTHELAAEMGIDAGAGALVNSVAPDSPGARAQLRPGDVIAAVDGKRVRDAQDFIREVVAHDVGQTVAVEVVRSAKRYATRVVLTARPEPAPPAQPPQPSAPQQGLGLSLRDLTAEQAVALGLPPRVFAQVVLVAAGSASERAGLRPGDVIVEADGASEPTVSQVAHAAADGHVLFRVRRRDAVFYAAVRR